MRTVAVPTTGILFLNTLVVDIVLRGGRASLMKVISLRIWARQRTGRIRLRVQWDGLTLSSCNWSIEFIILHGVTDQDNQFDKLQHF